MRILASADEIGNVKEIICHKGTDTSLKNGQQPTSVSVLLQSSELSVVRHRIFDMVVLKSNRLVALRHGGFVTFSNIDLENGAELSSHLLKLPLEEPEDNPIGLLYLEEHDSVLAAFQSGAAYIIKIDEDHLNLEPIAVMLPKSKTEESSFLSAIVQNPNDPGIFASGGKNSDLVVFRLFKSKSVENLDLNALVCKPKVLFRAENVEPDHLGIEQPVWIRKILFSKSSTSRHFRLITATNYGQIRVYESKEDSEPIGSYKVNDKPLISLQFACESEEDIVVSDTHTFVARLSLTQIDKKAQKIISASAGTFYKPSLKLLGKFSEGGNTGAIHGVDVDKKESLIACAGLDRYLRVFDIQTRKLLAKVYLGVQVSSVLILDPTDESTQSGELEAPEEDEFWNNLPEKETVQEEPVIKKRRRNL